jgi:aryl-alcohol dehydrogenase-like predicted oxidoreductase
MAIKFCTIQKFVVSTIIGATGMEQLRLDIGAINLDLTEELVKEINKIQLIYSNPCP